MTERSGQLHTDWQAIVDSLPDASFAVDAAGIIVCWNAAISRLTGWPAETMLGLPSRELALRFYREPRPILVDLLDADDETVRRYYQRIERTGIILRGESSSDNVCDWTLAIAAGPLISGGQRSGAVATIRDISVYREAEDQLAFLDTRDPMTGLYNRPHFERELRRLEHEGVPAVAIILCDIDGLKLYNDMAGNLAGDLVLLAASDIVKMAFRKGGLVARIDGDCFAIVLAPGDGDMAESICQEIDQAVFAYNQTTSERQLSLSMGWAIRTTAEQPLTDVCNVAEANLYRKKLNRSQSTRSSIVRTLLRTLSARDGTTGSHCRRLQTLVSKAASSLGLPEHIQTNLRLLSQFHDIGKIGVPDRVLLKRGPLEGNEIAEMRSHCEIGSRIAQSIPELAQISDWILKHHERWDGTGYPHGLRGEAIPIEVRLMSIVDAYDAMISDRPYRLALSHDEAINELQCGAGTQFDPVLVPFFVEFIAAERERSSDS